VAMEACAGAHYWAREIAKLGHHVRLIAPAYVKPFVKRRRTMPTQLGLTLLRECNSALQLRCDYFSNKTAV
jgi:transposase